MIEFDIEDLDALITVDGLVALDVKGKQVAVGDGFYYENMDEFIHAYKKEYGKQDFAWELGFNNIKDLQDNTPTKEALYDDCIDVFEFIQASDYEQEIQNEADDFKYAQAAGK